MVIEQEMAKRVGCYSHFYEIKNLLAGASLFEPTPATELCFCPPKKNPNNSNL